MLVQDTWTLEETARDAYLAVCARAADGAGLGAFKRDSAYRAVLEHVSEAQGRAYLDLIVKESPWLVNYFKRFQQNDRYGAPFTFNYDRRVFSPTTLRYAKVLGDLVRLFGSLEGTDIVEIGGGYGGQCKIVSDVFAFRSYTIIDLAPVGKLQQRYLSTLGVQGWTCGTPERLAGRSYDLVISNYALSELSIEGRRFYADSLLCRCPRGYITWNSPAPFDLFGHPLALQVTAERPQTGRSNIIITWGHA